VEVERVDFLSVASQDIERSRRFYLETLGLPFDRDVPSGGCHMAFFTTPTATR